MPKRNHGTQIMAEKYFNGDIIITDPCYIILDDRRDDWRKSSYGEDIFFLSFGHYLCKTTLIGDWNCEVFKGSGSRLWFPQAPEKKIGDFSADACKVCVFYLRDILRYNPAFDDHTNQPWCACWIKNFQGTVKIVTKLDPDGDESMHLIGVGNKSFFTRESYWSEVFPYKKQKNI